MTPHLTDDELIELFESRASGRAHLGTCPSCHDRWAEFSLLIEGFRDAANRRERDTFDLGAVQRVLEDEKERAQGVFEQHDTVAGDDVATWLRAQDKLRTLGGARVVLERAHADLEVDPQRALLLADFALESAETWTGHPRTMVLLTRGGAHLERANALRALGQFDDALDALASAECAFNAILTGAFDLARVWQVRAMILCARAQYDDAGRLAHKARETFAEFGDDERAQNCGLIEAAVLLERGRTTEARALYEELLAGAESESVFAARVLNNLGTTARKMGDTLAAVHYHARALPLFASHGLLTEVARNRFAQGSAWLRAGNLPEAVPLLDAARTELLGLGMRFEAGIATLDLAEACLAQDQPRVARELCTGLITYFQQEALPHKAQLALAYLTEAMTQEPLQRETLMSVRGRLEAAFSESMAAPA